jgi:lycopene cyclase domain-containing protein
LGLSADKYCIHRLCSGRDPTPNAQTKVCPLVHIVAGCWPYDNLIVGLQIVGYNPALITGLRLGYAPIEDFGYLVTGSFLVPCLWQRFGKPVKLQAQMSKD